MFSKKTGRRGRRRNMETPERDRKGNKEKSNNFIVCNIMAFFLNTTKKRNLKQQLV